MKFSSSLLVSGLLSLAFAQPLEHAHHAHNKREVVTVVVTQVLTSGPNGPIQKEVSSALNPTTSLAGSYTGPSSSFSTVVLSSGTAIPSASASSSSTASSPSSSGSSGPSGPVDISFAAGGKGITYSPYSNSGSCKDASTVASDIAKLSQFDVIRVYDTDCSGVSNVLAAKSSNQKIFLGIFHLNKISESIQIIQSAINAVDGGWDNVYAVSVGNELVNFGQATPADIKSAISTARSALTSAGYSGPIVSVDTLVAVQNNPGLCEYSDFIAVNSHPFWDGHVQPSDAGSFLKTQIANVKKTCGGAKNVLITETGWPTRGSNFGSCVPSIPNQVSAVSSIVKEVGDQVLLFTTYNDLWKAPGDHGVEQYWGLIQD